MKIQENSKTFTTAIINKNACRNVLVYDSGTVGAFLSYALTNNHAYRVTAVNEYMHDYDTGIRDAAFAETDKYINHFNGLTITHPNDLENLKRVATSLGLSLNYIGLTLGNSELDIKYKFFVELLLEIKHRRHTKVGDNLTKFDTDGMYTGIRTSTCSFLSPNNSRCNAVVDYKKLFIDTDLVEIKKLINLTGQYTDPTKLQKLIQEYTAKNIELVNKYAPEWENYFND